MKRVFLVFGLATVAAFIFINFPKNPSVETMMAKKQESKIDNKPLENVIAPRSSDVAYKDYSKSSFDHEIDKKRVYFFHAKWCPTCISADEEFINNVDKIPSDVILFRTDYDTAKELKARYGISYQHTFVYVDAQGIEINKWNGGGIAELIRNTTL